MQVSSRSPRPRRRRRRPSAEPSRDATRRVQRGRSRPGTGRPPRPPSGRWRGRAGPVGRGGQAPRAAGAACEGASGGSERRERVEDGQAQAASSRSSSSRAAQRVEGLDEAGGLQADEAPARRPDGGTPARGRPGPPPGPSAARGSGRPPRASIARRATGSSSSRDEVEQGGEGGGVLDPVEHLDGGQPGRPARGGEKGAQGLDDPGPEEGQARDGGVALGRPSRGEPVQQLLYAPRTGWYDRHDEGSSGRYCLALAVRRARPGAPWPAPRRPSIPLTLPSGKVLQAEVMVKRRGPRHGPDVPAVARRSTAGMLFVFETAGLPRASG